VVAPPFRVLCGRWDNRVCRYYVVGSTLKVIVKSVQSFGTVCAVAVGSVIAVRGSVGYTIDYSSRSSAVGGDVGQLPILIVDLENRRVNMRPEVMSGPNRPVHPARLVPLFPKQENPGATKVDPSPPGKTP